MAHGLETRSPFLDTAVVEFGASLPDRLRMRLGKGKILLRRAMKGILPESILARGQDGLRRAARGLVPRRARRARARAAARAVEPDLRVPAARSRWRRWSSATARAAADLSPQIWALLTLESWLRQEKGWGVGR